MGQLCFSIHLKIKAMKLLLRLFTVTALLIGIEPVLTAQEVVSGGNTYSAFGKYSIEETNTPDTLCGMNGCPYLVKFENSDIVLKVFIWKENGIKKYVALSDDLSVQYVCNKDFIGIEKLSKKFLKHGYCTNDSILNRSQYFHQKIIARGERSDIDNVALIASYYPHLVLKDHDTFLAN